MRVEVLGGGPAGLYFGILMKMAYPATAIRIHERNRADDTFGFGVVFSDETLGFFDEADPESAAEIRARFRWWRDIETYFRGQWTVSTGHGFAAISRQVLLGILQRRAAALGCEILFGDEVRDPEALRAADLVIGCDGVNSLVRERYAASFRPRIELGKCRFAWLGTTKPLTAFTFLFVETPHGLFQVHAYPFDEGRSTFIVETHEESWRDAGLDGASEDETIALCERLFAGQLDGHRLLGNRSIWRQFPTVSCESWRHGNVVLLGDAAHTAHFSIGSGTKLAMEDAIALVDAFRREGTDDVPRALAAYEEARRLDVSKLQRAAQMSREWFENSRRYAGQEPVPFTFNLMTRSKRITYDNLRERDPALVDGLDRWFQAAHRPAGAPPAGSPPPPLFTPFRARSVSLANRIVVSPMCQYSAIDGVPNDWHLVHLGSRALGGAGLVIAEMTDVSAEGRITRGCTGIWSRAQVAAWRRIVDFVHERSAAKIGLQIAHAGRKGSMSHDWSFVDTPLRPDEGPWPTLAPSAVPFQPGWPVPRAMTRRDMDRVREQFVARGAPRRRGRLRLARAARGARLPAVELPLAALELPRRRARRLAREPDALAARGRPRRPRRLAGRQAPLGARLGDRLARRGRDDARGDRDLRARAQGGGLRPRRRLLGRQLAALETGVRAHVPGALRRADALRGRHPGHGGRRHPRRRSRQHGAGGRARRPRGDRRARTSPIPT